MSSTLYDHALAFYTVLDSMAREEESDEGVTMLVFRGSITAAYRSLGISQAHYSQVRKALLEQDCITILRQGARGTESIVVLHHAPDEDRFEISHQERLIAAPSLVMLSRQVSDLLRLQGGINLTDLAVDFEQRLRALEREVKRLGKIAQQAQRARPK